MDKVLRLERLDSDQSTSEATLKWNHWKATFKNSVDLLPQEGLSKKVILINFLSLKIYRFVSEINEYERPIEILEIQYLKPKNEVYGRHKLTA